MKKKIALVSFIIIYCCFGLFAQSKAIKAPSGKIIAYECSNGNIKVVENQPVFIIRDSLGAIDTLIDENIEAVNTDVNTLLRMQDSVTIVDPNGNLIAVYDPLLKKVVSADGKLIFTIDETNIFYNSGGVVIGWMDENGGVFANDSNKIAEAPGVEPFKLAYYFFYNVK